MTPLFASEGFLSDISLGLASCVDDQGLYRPLECVLFPGSSVSVQSIGKSVAVEVPEYAPGTFYTTMALLTSKALKRPFPTKSQVIQQLHACVGLKYVWGANDPHGLSVFSSLYEGVADFFTGIDCSGLIYYAYSGYIPRNTGQLMTFGTAISLNDIEPLDICVWKGHVVVFLSKEWCIESREKKGCLITPTCERLEELYSLQMQEGDGFSEGTFVIRRVFEAAQKRALETPHVVV